MKKTIIILLLFTLNFCVSQSKYENRLNALYNHPKNNNSIREIEAFSKKGNTLSFMQIGYFINGNSIVGNYHHNDKVLNNLIKASSGKENYRWIVSNANKNNKSMEGKEFVLYEGYLFRYAAEYFYLRPNNGVSDKDFVKKNFFKWYNKSMRENKDASILYGVRLHMGSHWATVGAYLQKTDKSNSSIYKSFIEDYDKQIRTNLRIVNIKGHECYIWNATYPSAFTRILRNRIWDSPVIQDVSHGNHIVQYVVDSYNLGNSSWTKKDLERFRNTLKYIIWKNKNTPSDNVDGSVNKKLKGMGWKQSDGWMKLMNVLNDKELYTIYNNYYLKRTSKVEKFYPNIQYFANMSVFQKNNNQ